MEFDESSSNEELEREGGAELSTQVVDGTTSEIETVPQPYGKPNVL